MKALIIEDDADVAEAVSLAFQMGWPGTHLVSTHLGKSGIEMAEREKPDVIILDIGLPDISGFEVTRQVRSFSSVPIVILTVREDEGDAARGLGLGANDYLVRPCLPAELLSRVRVVIHNSCER